MRQDWKVLGSAMASFLAFAYVVCIAYDLATGATMYRAWTALLPGFRWISVSSFVLGLGEVVCYGLFFGLVYAPLYNFFLVKVWRQAA